MHVKTFLTFQTFLLLESVVAWTIDLPEARKYYFTKDESNNEIKKDIISPVYYDNINPNSALNKKYDEDIGNYENEKQLDNGYAGEYKYGGYMEKRVEDIVHKGSTYLEGLHRSIKQYEETLKNCSRFNRTDDGRNSSWLPENENPFNTTGTETECEEVTRKSEYVRRVAALAMWATRELQDLNYNDRYNGPGEWEQEENELILRLAWFLDRLAHLTGFEPEGKPDGTTQRPTTPLPTTPPALVQGPPRNDDVTKQTCIPTANGEQCLYPMPEEIRRVFEGEVPQTPTNTGPRPNSFQNPNFAIGSQTPRNIKKRSINDDPLLHVMKYYAKYKVWTNSNPTDGLNNEEHDPNAFIDQNHIEHKNTKVKIINKRSISYKKGQIHFIEDPYEDISNYLKHKPGVNYIKNEAQMEKVRGYLDKIRKSSAAKSYVKKLEKELKRPKRSVERSAYYRRKEQHRLNEDPHQDISYYVKNKRGTNYVVNIADNIQLRAGLEQVFQTGNLETVRRYGSNYNPANPNPLAAGAAEAMTDT